MGPIGYLVVGLGLMPVIAGAEIRVVGSDLLGVELTPALREFARRNDSAVTVALSGSLSGWQDIQNGRADIGLLSFSPHESVPTAPYYAAAIAHHVVVVLAPDASPLNQVSFDQLREVFGQTDGSGWKRWSDLGVMGEPAGRNVIPHALVRPDSIQLELFRFEVLQSRPLNSGLKFDRTEAEMERLWHNDAGAIALAAQVPLEIKSVRALSVSREAKGMAFLPTAPAVYRGDYPLKWPVYVVFRRAEVSRLYPLLRYLLGEEAAQVYQRAELLPIPVEARRDLLFGLERLEK